ncbi:tetratricopeptide repeat protein [Thalassoroseus pseudoceratinae]|uniref:tetratricopeptide repeat protein n=1 Tax=Thalassoroseus pseudoceratinae TaxID=2713176 RepID=UPI00141DA9AE|nr:hypothetical protein [Thalassoroseus pseudoceratinae]
MMTKSLETAENAFENGELEVALHSAKNYLKQSPECGYGWELLGLIQGTRGRFAIAVSALERASLFVPLRPLARVCLGYGYGKIGRTELSRDLLCDLIDNSQMTIDMLLQIASALDAIDQPGDAMRACRVATERDPLNAQSYYDMGHYAARCGYPIHLIEGLARKAISLDPENVCYRIGVAGMLIKQDRHDEAYGFVSELSLEQIQEITCECCLRKVVKLYETQHDYRRVVLCQQRLLDLELSK